MNPGLKKKILEGLYDIYLHDMDNADNMTDIFNLVKIVEHYEEFIPEIKQMLNNRAERIKWNNKTITKGDKNIEKE